MEACPVTPRYYYVRKGGSEGVLQGLQMLFIRRYFECVKRDC